MSKNALWKRKASVMLVLGSVGLIGSFLLFQESRAVELAPHLHLKASKNELLGSKEFPDGEVKYAYKTNKRIDGNPTDHALRKGQEKGLLVRGERVDQRTKHSRTFTTSDPNTFVTEIIAGEPQYYLDDNGMWWQADYATTTKEAFDAQTRQSPLSALFQQAFAETDTFYPDAAEVVSMDGRVRAPGVNWASVHGASTGDSASVSDTNDQCASSAWIGSGIDLYYINRGFFLFDTSTIDDAHSIHSATMSIYVDWKKTEDDDGNDFISIVTTTPAATTSLSTADFDQVGSTEQHDSGQRKDISSITLDQYVNWTLNATGLGNISKTGVTKFGTREGHDLLNDEYSHGGPNAENYIFCDFSDESGTATDPKLVVVHSAANADLDIRKSANQNITSSTALTADSELKVTLSPNKQYSIEGVVFASSSSATPDIKIGWNFPTDITSATLGYLAGDDANYRGSELLQTANSASQTIPLAANTPAIIKVSGSVVVGNSTSTLSFLFAQATSDANPTTVLKGSYLRAQEIVP